MQSVILHEVRIDSILLIMNPEYNNQTPPNTTDQPNEVPSLPPAQQPPVLSPAQNQFADKAWKKTKIGAILLIASCGLGLILLPSSYSYTVETTTVSASSLILLYASSALLQVILVIIGFRLLKREWALVALASAKRRAFILLPILFSALFVMQWNKFANLAAFALLLFAGRDLNKVDK